MFANQDELKHGSELQLTTIGVVLPPTSNAFFKVTNRIGRPNVLKIAQPNLFTTIRKLTIQVVVLALRKLAVC